MNPNEIYAAWRKGRGLSHAQMARLLATTRRTSERWEGGSSAIPPLVTKILSTMDRHPRIMEWLGKPQS
jgi:DNA-binding transcriptional regulator YiaG